MIGVSEESKTVFVYAGRNLEYSPGPLHKVGGRAGRCFGERRVLSVSGLEFSFFFWISL